MLSTILNTLQESTADEIVKKADVSQDQLPGIFNTIGDVAQDKIGGQLSAGNISGLMSLFSNNANNSQANGIQSMVTSAISSGLSEKLGLSSSQVTAITSIVVPKLISLITSKNSETPADDPSPLADIFGGGSLGNAAKGVLGNLF